MVKVADILLSRLRRDHFWLCDKRSGVCDAHVTGGVWWAQLVCDINSSDGGSCQHTQSFGFRFWIYDIAVSKATAVYSPSLFFCPTLHLLVLLCSWPPKFLKSLLCFFSLSFLLPFSQSRSALCKPVMLQLSKLISLSLSEPDTGRWHWKDIQYVTQC